LPPAPEKFKKITPSAPVVKRKINSILFFKIIIFLCFVIFYYLGIKNNYIGFLKSKDKIDALLSAIGFFSFSVVMLECFIFFMDKKIKWVFLTLFFIMF
jgi:hypothetical protein